MPCTVSGTEQPLTKDHPLWEISLSAGFQIHIVSSNVSVLYIYIYIKKKFWGGGGRPSLRLCSCNINVFYFHTSYTLSLRYLYTCRWWCVYLNCHLYIVLVCTNSNTDVKLFPAARLVLVILFYLSYPWYNAIFITVFSHFSGLSKYPLHFLCVCYPFC